jgi:hypothetical protein
VALVVVAVWLVAQLGGGTSAAQLGGGVEVAQLGGGTRATGGTSTSRSAEQIQRSVTQPLPALPPAPAPRNDRVWVPDRYVPGPAGTIHVPGHWEQPISSTQSRVPPLVVCDSGGHCTFVPGGVRPPAEQRPQAP